MDSKADMYVRRARSEIESASILFEASCQQKVKDMLKLGKSDTFYSGVISHAYYAIFYCAKAMLLTKNIETKPPEIHKKTFEKFKEAFIDTGVLDAKLLIIYRELIVRAEMLLEVYKRERKKRGDFTYNTIPQANKAPAEESINHARLFFRHCDAYLSG
jgi:uncharacterized protein (UPF0332 family)